MQIACRVSLIRRPTATSKVCMCSPHGPCVTPLCAGKKVSDGCKEDLAKFKIDRASNVNKNLPLGAWCHVYVLGCRTHLWPAQPTHARRTCTTGAKMSTSRTRAPCLHACGMHKRSGSVHHTHRHVPRELKNELSEACQKEVFKVELDVRGLDDGLAAMFSLSRRCQPAQCRSTGRQGLPCGPRPV